MSLASKVSSLVLLSTITLLALLLFLAQYAIPLPSNNSNFQRPVYASLPIHEDDDEADRPLTPHFSDHEDDDDEDEEQEDFIEQITRRLDLLKAPREQAKDNDDVSDLEI